MTERDVDRLDSDDLPRVARDGLPPPHAASGGGGEPDATADRPPANSADDDETPDAAAGGATEGVESRETGDDVMDYFSLSVTTGHVLPMPVLFSASKTYLRRTRPTQIRWKERVTSSTPTVK